MTNDDYNRSAQSTINSFRAMFIFCFISIFLTIDKQTKTSEELETHYYYYDDDDLHF